MTIDVINNVLLAPSYWALLSFVVLVLIGRSRNTAAHTLHALLLIVILGVILIPLSRWLLPTLEWPVLPGAVSGFLSFPIYFTDPQWGMFQWVIAMYLGVLLLLWLRILMHLASAYMLLVCSHKRVYAEHLQMMAHYVAQLGIRRAVSLRYSKSIATPVTLGWYKPYILMPVQSLSWPQDMTKNFLIHELAHIRRGDWLTLHISKIIVAIVWILPPSWLLLRKLEWFAELSCDDLVVAQQKNRTEYAQHLLHVSKNAASYSGTLSLIELSNHYQRIAAVLDGTRVRQNASGVQYGYTVCMFALLVIGCCLKLSVHPYDAPSNIKIFPLSSLPTVYEEKSRGVTGAKSAGKEFGFMVPPSVPLMLPITAKVETRLDSLTSQLHSNLDVDFTEPELSLPTALHYSPDLRLRKMVKPKYPSAALRKEKEGTVLVEFDISIQGYVQNARIIQSSHYPPFDRAALDAIKNYEYFPPTIHGEVTAVENVTEVFRFQIHEDAKR